MIYLDHAATTPVHPRVLEAMQRAYAHAIATRYRFFSYGDACLLFPEGAS